MNFQIELYGSVDPQDEIEWSFIKIRLLLTHFVTVFAEFNGFFWQQNFSITMLVSFRRFYLQSFEKGSMKNVTPLPADPYKLEQYDSKKC